MQYLLISNYTTVPHKCNPALTIQLKLDEFALEGSFSTKFYSESVSNVSPYSFASGGKTLLPGSPSSTRSWTRKTAIPRDSSSPASSSSGVPDGYENDELIFRFNVANTGSMWPTSRLLL